MDGLTGVNAEKLWTAAAQAQYRMQLYFTGRVHELISEFASTLRGILISNAGEDGQLDELGHYTVTVRLGKEWASVYAQYKELLDNLSYEAASIEYGVLAFTHDKLVKPNLLQEQSGDPYVFDPQLNHIVHAANTRIESGLQRSDRIWSMDRQSLRGMERVVADGVVQKKGAWDIAKQLEGFLGAGAECPRWTRTRLRLTKKQIALGDPAGLLRGEECGSKGVAYKALRFGRNELQIIHGMATDDVMARMPWILKEQVNLSPSHPVDDVCDQVVRDGEGGVGIYPKGTINIPIHVQCLCWKSPVQMSEEDFQKQLQGWAGGTTPWPEMDQYNSLVGDMFASLVGTAAAHSLEVWALDGPDKMDTITNKEKVLHGIA